ncbi:phosphotransferase [Arthrobacter sp. JSM 101049]|uniref:phosphotransferase n=1 Tax=Arthrobacter sp. JSM 101049 TaxID=929097 RepID=UPI003563EE3C
MAEWNDYWGTEAWLDQVDAWVSMVLDTYELHRTAPLERGIIELWSTQVVVHTDHGKLFFKAVNPGQQSEVALTAAAARLAPDQLVMPLAVEPLRGWMISPDYGETMARIPSTDYQLWGRILRDFARLQRHLVPHGDELFDAGLGQLDPAFLPGYIDEQLLLHASLPTGHPLHLPERDAEDLHRQLGPVRDMAAFLAAGPVPLSLDHNDLHRGNAFLPASPEEPLRFIDLGDAYWAHPFASLAMPLRTMSKELGTTPSDPRIRTVVNAYLHEWEDYGPVEELRHYIEPALRLGKLQAHATWMRMLTGASDADLDRHAAQVLRPLSELVSPLTL